MNESLEKFKSVESLVELKGRRMPIGVVITFDDAENKAWVMVSETDLNHLLGHEARFAFSKTLDFKGKVIGVETDFLAVRFEQRPPSLGQGSQVSIAY